MVLDIVFTSIASLTSFISTYGYIAIFISMLLESIIFPIPSEIILPFTGFLIAIGKINPILGFIDAITASLLGSVIGYILGYFFGIDIFLRYGKKIGFSEKSYYNAINWMQKYGVYFAFISKLLPAIRSIASIICGAFKLSPKKFILYSTLGILIWSSLLVYLGFVLTSNWIYVGGFIMASTPYIIVLSAIFLLFLLRKYIINLLKKFFGKKK